MLLPALVTGALLSVFGGAGPAAAADSPVGLGTAGAYSVLGGQTVTNTGPSSLDSDLGVSPGTAITGFPPGQVGGATHAGDAVALQAQSDLTTAYNDAAGRATTESVTGDLVGKTLTSGVYTSSGPLGLSGTVTLNAQGNPNAVFIFQVASTLITASASNVAMINGAQECNVFWQIGSSATLGTASVFRGNLMALTSISVNTDTTVHGRALARNGAVTLDNDTFTSPTCDTTEATPSATTASITATTAGTVTMAATVTGASTPTGTVTFTSNGVTLGAAAVDDAGRATLTVPASAGPGTSPMTATYSGNDALLSSVSTPVALAAPTVPAPGNVPAPGAVPAPGTGTTAGTVPAPGVGTPNTVIAPRINAPGRVSTPVKSGTPSTSAVRRTTTRTITTRTTTTPPLSQTGFPVVAFIATAAGLLALGLALTWTGRRRRYALHRA